jgi:hypothetical protein
MISSLPFLLPVLGVLFLVTLRFPKNALTSTEHIELIKQVSDSVHGEGIAVDERPALDDSEYTYDVVGESYRRDNLTALIRAHNAFETGQILSTAVLELEPSNSFDSSAVKVVVEGTQVGYIPKFDSPAVTEMIKKSGKKVYEVPVRIGWDTDSPSPLIGVRLAFTVE